MINVIFVAALGALLGALLLWGFKTLPAERWQIIAAVPVAKKLDGGWHGLNLTFYGFFSATGTIFGVAMAILLLFSVRISLIVGVALVAAIVAVCLPASRMVAGIVEKKRNTYTIAGAAFVAALLLPPVVWVGQTALDSWTTLTLYTMPALAAAAIAYALAEAIGRLACISFGCCYGMPLRHASPWLAQLFRRHHTVFHGLTKKAAYASGLDDEPLIPVQAITSIVFALSGLIGLSCFLAQRWRLALVIPMVGTWGWRAMAENLRADHRGRSRISAYQVMSIIALAYLIGASLLLPSRGPEPDLALALTKILSVGMLVALQGLWVLVFLFYGRSRVTASLIAFHLVRNEL